MPSPPTSTTAFIAYPDDLEGDGVGVPVGEPDGVGVPGGRAGVDPPGAPGTAGAPGTPVGSDGVVGVEAFWGACKSASTTFPDGFGTLFPLGTKAIVTRELFPSFKFAGSPLTVTGFVFGK